MYADSVVTIQMIGRLGARIDDAEEAILYALATNSGSSRREAIVSLNARFVPDVEVLLANVSRRVADNDKQVILARLLAIQWSDFLGRVAGEPLQGDAPAVRAAQA